MKEVVFVSDAKVAFASYQDWNLITLLQTMMEAAEEHGHSEDEFGLVVVSSGDDLFDVLWSYSDKSPRYMEFVLHGAKGILVVNGEQITTDDFCQWIFRYQIQPQILVIRACGQRSSDYDFLRDIGIDVRMGRCGSDFPGNPIFNPYDLKGTGNRIWVSYADEFYPTEKELTQLFPRPEPPER